MSRHGPAPGAAFERLREVERWRRRGNRRAGTDLIDALAGNDQISGGGSGDLIADFETGVDKIDLRAVTPAAR